MRNNEVWVTIREFEGEYEVSNLGRVRSLKSNRIIRPTMHPHGNHLQVVLSFRGDVFGRKVHRLVCEAFNGPPPFEDAQALHSDDIPFHNFPDNLCWGTHQDNMSQQSRELTSGENHWNSTLSWKKVREIRRLYKEGAKPADIARLFELDGPHVHRILKEKIWKEPTQ